MPHMVTGEKTIWSPLNLTAIIDTVNAFAVCSRSQNDDRPGGR
jgi:hypothetical protein